MIDNIKQLWDRMLPATKNVAVATLKEEFNLISTVFVKQTWIWGGGIPEDKQAKVLYLFKKIVKQQEKETSKLMDV